VIVLGCHVKRCGAIILSKVSIGPFLQQQAHDLGVSELGCLEKGCTAIIHRKVYRPWGSYESLSTGPSYQVKRIIVNPGASISLQKHFKRSEHWVVVEGLALVHLDGVETPLGPNQSIYIPMGSVHRMTNRGSLPLVLIEVQSGSYLGEDDIVRLEDAYNRT
jgi:mannose-6-phosphate isomerase-like protein (cupin superfamily)